MEKDQPRFWGPIQEVIQNNESHCREKNYKHIVEIGPGFVPFSLANTFIGCNETISNYISLDIDENPLPFGDKEVDFIYCRHVLEDIQNPNFVLKEMIRCSKSFYVETPSPLVEITKGVDSTREAHLYSGYHHHRYMVWSNKKKNQVYFLPKYSNIIDNFWQTLPDGINFLKDPRYWNNYFLWEEGMDPPQIIVYKNGVNMGVQGNFIQEYVDLLYNASLESIENTDHFFSTIL